MIDPVRPQDASGVYRRQIARAAEAADEQEGAARGRNAGSRRSDQITLSEQARDLRTALAAVEAQPETREELVAALRRQIAEGTYRPDPSAIARRMLTEGGDA
jgi:negative regulator of flagellin synthesis FlgM